MTVIGIDPGASCGWAARVDGRRIASGVWDLDARRHEGGGMRYLRARTYFRELVKRMRDGGTLDAVAYEEVRRHRGTDAAHVYGGIVAVIGAECEALGIPFSGVPVGTVKKLATGKGNADKDEMMAAFERDQGRKAVKHDEADAWFVATALARELGES
jgi:crossover junction endodeoxyribonuclease RuvC